MKTADEKYILRFEQPGHRARIKQQAIDAKRSLNKQLLMLIEAGERTLPSMQISSLQHDSKEGQHP